MKILISIVLLIASCGNEGPRGNTRINIQNQEAVKMNVSDTTELATFGAGCFWCVEAVYLSIEGVTSVKSGYCGGQTKNPPT